MLSLLCMLFLIPAILVCSYYVGLAVHAITFRRPGGSRVCGDCKTSFAIVIPAHNEEANLAGTLESCAAMAYPRDRFKVFVIADNCTDGTAKVASDNGVVCYERRDEQRRGKGFALEFAFERILPQGFDAIVVLDADCVLDAHALSSFDHHLRAGHPVLQANDVASNADDSVMAYVVGVGNFIENELFYTPKSSVGLSVFLRGTGMVFRREILEAYPWCAHSIVEDVEYALRLLENGISVKFVNEVKVCSPFPAREDQLAIQRTRWASGNLGFGRSQGFRLILSGIQRRSLRIADAGWTLLVLSRPLVLLQLFVTILLAAGAALIKNNTTSTCLLAVTLAVVVLQALYFGSGIVFFGLNRRRFEMLLSAPVVIGKLIVISLLGILGIDRDNWARTPR